MTGDFTAHILIAVFLLLAGCAGMRAGELRTLTPDCPLHGEALLTRIQEQTFRYFWDGAEPTSGMALERIHIDGHGPEHDRHIVTTGGSGFGLMAILVGMERGFVTREEGLERFERIVAFLEGADRFHGAWPHWLDGRTGETVPFSALDDGADLVETAFLVQGLLTVRQHYQDGSEREQRLAERIDRMWREVEWNWFRQDEQNVLSWHWSPNHGWAINHHIRGYDEAMIVYILAAASPTHPVPPEVYHEGWARDGEIRMEGHEQYGYNLPLRHNAAAQYGGPLFWAHYSFLCLDPRGLVDQYGDYWQNNVNHTRINRQWALENPNDCAGYGPNQWGLTASYSRVKDGAVGYAGHSPGANDRCVITPTAALSSFPYTPEYSMDVADYLYNEKRDWVWGPYGFYDAYSQEHQWYPARYLAIDQGPIILMIENHRTGLLWDLFMTSSEVLGGLRRLGFSSPHL
jgi:hypothetical protein